MYYDFNFLFFLFLLILILPCGILYWSYRNYIKLYSGFPKHNFLMFVLKCVLMSKVPKHTSIYHFFFQHLLEKCKKFQDEGICLFWFCQPFLFIYSEQAFKVFSNENTTINKPYIFDLFKEVFMNSLLTSGGDLWKKRRKMLNPVFYLPNLKDKVNLINRNSRSLVKNLQMLESEVPSNILNILDVFAFRNIYEFLTGLHLEDQKNSNEHLIDIVNKGTEVISYRIWHPWMHPRCILSLSSRGRYSLKLLDNFLKSIEKILEKIKESLLCGKEEAEKEKESDNIYRNSRRTFAQVIFKQHEKDQTYSSTDMQGELGSMITAGYHTVAHAMMWNLFLLGHNSAAQDQVYEEVESVMGQNNEVSYDDLQNLKYLECVIKESLRLYPPVPMYTKRTVKDIQCGKYKVPRNTNIVFFPFLLHRDPCIFPDPEKFNPERFVTENSEKKLPTFFFAEGVRNCIGKNFAMMELKIMLAHMIKNFKLTSLDSPEAIALKWEIVLGTDKPLRICLTPRQNILVQG